MSTSSMDEGMSQDVVVIYAYLVGALKSDLGCYTISRSEIPVEIRTRIENLLSMNAQKLGILARSMTIHTLRVYYDGNRFEAIFLGKVDPLFEEQVVDLLVKGFTMVADDSSDDGYAVFLRKKEQV